MTFKMIFLMVGVHLVLFGLSSVKGVKDPKTLCYYESWVHWRQGQGKMDPTEIDSKLCTHMAYSYFSIDPSTHELKLTDPYLMNDLHDLEKFSKSKGNSKALIAIGGATMSDQFSLTSSVPGYLESFVTSVMNFLSKNGFDGVMIDWSNLQASDSDNFVKLLDKFDEKFSQTSYCLGVTVPAMISLYDNYRVDKISKFVDLINVATLDYTGSWAHTVGHASPFPQQLQTLEAYNKRGAPRHKLLMAVPAYARTWKLADKAKQEVGDRATNPGTKGPYTQVEGLLSYNELCVMMKNENTAFTIVRDSAQTAIYAVYLRSSQAEWYSFEDTKSLSIKAKNITEQGYGGMSLYTLSNEDSHGLCGDKYPLLHAIEKSYSHSDVTEPNIVTVTPVHKVTEKVTDIPGVFKCHQEGYFRDKVYCGKYYLCEKSSLGFEKTVMNCPKHGEAFDETTRQCVDHTKIPGC